MVVRAFMELLNLSVNEKKNYFYRLSQLVDPQPASFCTESFYGLIITV